MTVKILKPEELKTEKEFNALPSSNQYKYILVSKNADVVGKGGDKGYVVAASDDSDIAQLMPALRQAANKGEVDYDTDADNYVIKQGYKSWQQVADNTVSRRSEGGFGRSGRN